MPTPSSNISGCVAARNSVKFKYPLRECIEALLPFCDEVVLAYDHTTGDGTRELALQLKAEWGIVLKESVWDMGNMQRGLEIGHQSQVAVEACSPHTQWRLCVQQDEAFHEEDAPAMRELVKSADASITGFDFVRPYFFGNLRTIRRDWSPKLTRLTRTGANYTYDGFDGQNCMATGPIRNEPSGIWLYHYSRIGDPELIARRVRNVDSFFHAEENLPAENELPPYDFSTREYDSYAITEHPREVPADLVEYRGGHPAPYARLYKDFL